ncbi:hypothetical protein [Aliidiomarina haloalkalitolerans]|uniref:MSHA biogenesis protein MshK n=1 Tax=Aliidiomarina haloalkalitolerans TaxID=859059 RepID=A0A432VPJ1_9GAMM|nr:hypothetical protein [Aliidiomarina haloalkalitolerans]RUO18079.1 hypothetical protein CWE06_11940 [Aliidiomarina haloalkalitolerans]
MKTRNPVLLALAVASLTLANVTLVGAVQAQQSERDPTRPPARFATPAAEQGQAAIEYKLKMVTVVGGRYQAVVNEHHVRVGDRLDDWRVSRIQRDRVILRRGDEVQVLSVFGELRKTEVRDNG